jgi:lysyl-tRNA synthetase class I
MDPKELLNNPEQIKNLIAVLQALLPNNNQEDDSDDEPQTKTTQPVETKQHTHNIKTKTRRRVGSGSNEPTHNINKFDQMTEARMHKDDGQIDKLLSKHPPVARMRDFDPINVVCRVCGKKETVSPTLVFEGASRYKCNNCSTQAG